MKFIRGMMPAVIAILLLGMSGCSRPLRMPPAPPAGAGTRMEGLMPTPSGRVPRLVIPEFRSSAPISADQAFYSAWIDVGGRTLYLACQGVGEPVVVFDMDQSESGAEALAYAGVVSTRTRVCYYDRPNVYGGYSDPAQGARASQDIVNDLAVLLRQAGLVSPFILVGKSFGAMNAALFAAQRPNDVVGLALLDPLPPGEVERGAEAGEIEVIDMPASAAQLAAAPGLLSVPTALLTTERMSGDPAAYIRLSPWLQRVSVSDNGGLTRPSTRDRVARVIIEMIEQFRK